MNHTLLVGIICFIFGAFQGVLLTCLCTIRRITHLEDRLRHFGARVD